MPETLMPGRWSSPNIRFEGWPPGSFAAFVYGSDTQVAYSGNTPVAPIMAIAFVALILAICAIYNPTLGSVLAVLTIPMWINLLLIRGGR